MTCQTCKGKGIRFEPELVGDQYEVVPQPCPECGEQEQEIEDDGFITIYPKPEKCK
jgi:DnaJ-class molecular chaperone